MENVLDMFYLPETGGDLGFSLEDLVGLLDINPT